MKQLFEKLTENSLKAVALLLLFGIGLAACDEDDTPTVEQDPNIVELAQSQDQLSTLVNAVTQADLATTLADESKQYTVFAPNNSAFAAFLADNPDYTTLADIPEDVLADVLQYHVVSGKVLAADLENGPVTTLSGETILVNVDNGVTLNGDVTVVSADNEASNGVVHIINGVLSPAEEDTLQTIVEIVQAGDDFSILETALTKFPDLIETLSSEGPFTVFGPNNAAFAKFLEEDDRFGALADIPDSVLKAVLQYHVLAGKKTAADLTASETTVQGEAITIAKGDSVVLNGDITVKAADVMASNGVIHVINNVLLPPSLQPEEDTLNTIVEIVVAGEDFSILETALTKFPDLIETLSSEGPFTVFGPTNDAFAKFLDEDERFEELSDIPDDILKAVLQYHVLAGMKTAADLTDSETTVQGENIAINKEDGVVLNGNVNVTAPNVMASNGVIHVIDNVLLPPSLQPAPLPTIAAIASDTEALSTLVAALGRVPSLLETADNPEADITVFAPTNDAFTALLNTLGAESLDDIPDFALEIVLKYHILASGKLADALQATETTLEGSTISIDKSNGVVINGNANVVEGLANIEAANGVVHVIDQVLLPPIVTQVLGTMIQPLLFDPEDRFTTLITAVISQPDILNFLIEPREGDNRKTLFAPTNAAFEALIDASDEDDLNSIEDVLALENLGDILLYHVGVVFSLSTDLTGDAGATHSELMRDGRALEIPYTNENGMLFIQGNAVIGADNVTGNGVVHFIDGVLLPPM